MCGIMGYIGDENAVDVIIDGLEQLEYRGYDSAGYSVVINKEIKTVKVVGSPSGLRNKSDNIFGNLGIGHTRWATHGRVCEENAHPQFSNNGMFTVVHNGIIENYKELKKSLTGYRFKSETDTEIIAHLLEKNYNGDLKGTVGAVLQMLKGSYALGILCSDYPDTIVCAKNSSPIFIGTSTEETFLSSDVSVLAQRNLRIFKLNDKEIGILKKDSFKVYDFDGCRIRKTEIKISKVNEKATKESFEHYMLKEIYQQPDAIEKTLNSLITSAPLNGINTESIQRVLFIACGSAYHAGLTGANITEKLTGIPSTSEIASEFRYRNPHIDSSTLVVIISQSGETADTLAALRIAKKNNAQIISIVNVENSTIAMESDCVIFTKAGREIAVATTKAYSAQLVAIYYLAISLSFEKNTITQDEKKYYFEEIRKIPEKVQDILSNFNYEKFVQKILESDYICFIGRSLDYCTAMEASLKLKEISYIHCEAYAAGELKHGTISLVDDKSLIFALNCCSDVAKKTLSNIEEAAARGADIIRISTDNRCDIIIPETDDIFYPLLEIVPLQLIAYNTARVKGYEIDKPRNLAKSVTVE